MMFYLDMTDLQYNSQKLKLPMGPKQPGPTVVLFSGTKNIFHESLNGALFGRSFGRKWRRRMRRQKRLLISRRAVLGEMKDTGFCKGRTWCNLLLNRAISKHYWRRSVKRDAIMALWKLLPICLLSKGSSIKVLPKCLPSEESVKSLSNIGCFLKRFHLVFLESSWCSRKKKFLL